MQAVELEDDTLWVLGLNSLGIRTALIALAHDLSITGLHPLWALLIVLPVKICVPQELGVHPLNRLISS